MSEIKYYKAIRSGTARGISGSERDRGHIVHLVTNDKYPSWSKAICGIEPKGNGWYYPTDSDKLEVTCEKCCKKVSKQIIKEQKLKLNDTLKVKLNLHRKSLNTYNDKEDYFKRNPNAKFIIFDTDHDSSFIDNLPRVPIISEETIKNIFNKKM